MKTTVAHLIFSVILTAAPLAAQDVVSLGEPEPLKLADGTQIKVGSLAKAAPIYEDFNGDGVPDLIVGEFEDGLCHIYINHGTAAEPIFKQSTPFMAGGDVAIVPPS